jgi:hypothetical protein
MLLWVLLLAGGAFATYYLLSRLTAQGGGHSSRVATAIVDQVLGDADAYRGSRTDDPPWDGQNRIAPPISDGLWGGWGLIRRRNPPR